MLTAKLNDISCVYTILVMLIMLIIYEPYWSYLISLVFNQLIVYVIDVFFS